MALAEALEQLLSASLSDGATVIPIVLIVAPCKEAPFRSRGFFVSQSDSRFSSICPKYRMTVWGHGSRRRVNGGFPECGESERASNLAVERALPAGIRSMSNHKRWWSLPLLLAGLTLIAV